jgi:hypothetical protein
MDIRGKVILARAKTPAGSRILFVSSKIPFMA